MAELRCDSVAEKHSCPGVHGFFPDAVSVRVGRVRRARRRPRPAAACSFAQRSRHGGIASIKGELIDDCSLGANMKKAGAIRLGLTRRAQSVRPYATWPSCANGLSLGLQPAPLLAAALIGTLAGMAITFVAPPMLALFASGLPRYFGLLAWAAMSLSFVPTLRYYRLSPIWRVSPPGNSLLYMSYTLNSAYQHFRRQGRAVEGARPCRRAEPVMDRQRTASIGQRLARREFSGRVLADQATTPAGNPGLL